MAQKLACLQAAPLTDIAFNGWYIYIFFKYSNAQTFQVSEVVRKPALPTWYIIKKKKLPSNTFGSDLNAYLAQTSSVRWDDGEPNSVTQSRYQEEEENIGNNGKKKREEEIRQILEAEEHTFTSGFPHRKEVFEI